MNKPNFQLYPIQLKDITVTKLSITINDPPAAREYEGEVDLKIELGRSDFIDGDSNISVGLRVKTEPNYGREAIIESSTDEENTPAFLVEVELQGHFEVDLLNFSHEHLERWSKVNAPFLLLPYVREHVYGLALRGGIRGLVFPLFTQPGTGGSSPRAKSKE